MLRLVFALLLLGLGAPCLGQTNSAVPTTNTAVPVATKSGAPQSAESDRLGTELELKRENAVLQARSDLSGEAYSRLEILIGAFGALITVIVLFFALRVERAAFLQTESALLKMREALEQQMRPIVEKATAAASSAAIAQAAAELALTSAQSHAAKTEEQSRDAEENSIRIRKAAEAADRILAQQMNQGKQADLTIEDRKIVAEAADAANDTPSKQRSLQDYRMQIVSALLASDWEALKERSLELESAHPNDDEGLSLALFQRAYALDKLGHRDDARTLYGIHIDRFKNKSDLMIAKRVNDSFFNRACSYALEGSTPGTIESLKAWADRCGNFDCDNVRRDPDFDGIRHDIEFKDFLEKMGCGPAEIRDQNIP